MKKIISIILSFLFISSAVAMNPADFLNKIPDNFTPECYEYYYKIDKGEVRNNKTNEKYQTYKINIDNRENLVVSQFGFILPYKYFSNENNIYNYTNNVGWDDIRYLTDYNNDTFYELDSKTNDEIILSFDKVLEKNNFSFTFNYYSSDLSTEYYISDNNINWDLVKRENLSDFSFKYLKIKFVNKSKVDSKIYRELIKISELNLSKNGATILIKSFYNDNIEIYSKYNCKDKNFSTTAKTYDDFSIDKNTKIIDVKMMKNPKYDVYTKKDLDNDWVEDEIDNCISRYNPDQKDSNGDGIGDMCSDDDNDGIIGYYDNCVNVSNADQKDVNNNGVGDVCEFDKDEDGIFDSIDNCIVKANPEQLDSDKDGIGDACDNCEYYNPSQRDENQNGIGDVCDNKVIQVVENDDDKDGIINNKDNCKDVANENQLDSDKDGIGDACDNCINVDNKDQLDLDENGIGDMCEDSDGDGYLGYLDNCINISNQEQLDDDNDGIGNACEDDDNDGILFVNDNCPYDYNPMQEDVDKDGIGDRCDEQDDRYIESNRSFFIGLLVIIALIFVVGIFSMVKKLK